jgi:hypothetical protein
VITNQVVAKSTHLRGLPDLHLIGVPEQMQSRAPNPASFPTKFNGDSRRFWMKLLNDDKFKAELKQYEAIEDKWYRTILKFLDVCEEEGILPFAAVTEQQKNDSVMQYLQNSRHALVKFVNNIGLFEKLKIQKACREFIRKPNGFIVTSWATCKPNLDPTFEKWLVTAPSPRFTPSTNNMYVKHIQSNLTLWVRYVSKTRITVGYEIHTATPVSIPGKRLPTRKEVDSFIDRTIWLPTVRANRFENVTNRLF